MLLVKLYRGSGSFSDETNRMYELASKNVNSFAASSWGTSFGRMANNTFLYRIQLTNWSWTKDLLFELKTDHWCNLKQKLLLRLKSEEKVKMIYKDRKEKGLLVQSGNDDALNVVGKVELVKVYPGGENALAQEDLEDSLVLQVAD